MDQLVLQFSFPHLLISFFESIFVFLIYYPMIPMYWATAHLEALVGCVWAGDIWVVLAIGGMLLGVELWPLIGGLVAYVGGLGIAAHVLSCGDFMEVTQGEWMDTVLLQAGSG